MGKNVKQCLVCGAWNWHYSEKCAGCGNNDLEPSYNEVIVFLDQIAKQREYKGYQEGEGI